LVVTREQEAAADICYAEVKEAPEFSETHKIDFFITQSKM
jgi:hypothetical protein